MQKQDASNNSSLETQFGGRDVMTGQGSFQVQSDVY
jgi:hypothetical protein